MLDMKTLKEEPGIYDKFYVYAHIRPDINKIFYVGKGKMDRAYSIKRRNNHWHNIVNKAGGFDVIFLLENLTENAAFLWERLFIKVIGRNNLCNMTDGGEGISGLIFTEEHRKNLSKAHLGIKLSEDAKRKLSKFNKGKKITEEHKKKLSVIRKGIPISDQHKQKISISLKGRKGTTSKSVIQMDKNRDLINTFDSAKDAERITGIWQSNITLCCQGKRRSSGGYIWKYA